jgi:hypothetical protein
VEESKPAPEAVGVALKKLDLPGEQVLMVGDTPYDVESAARSGVGTVVLRCGGSDDARLGGALAIDDTPADLLAHHDASPFAGEMRPCRCGLMLLASYSRRPSGTFNFAAPSTRPAMYTIGCNGA